MAQIDDYQIKLQDLDTMPNVENILNDLRETQYTAANKEEEAERVTEDCKKKLIVV